MCVSAMIDGNLLRIFLTEVITVHIHNCCAIDKCTDLKCTLTVITKQYASEHH